MNISKTFLLSNQCCWYSTYEVFAEQKKMANGFNEIFSHDHISSSNWRRDTILSQDMLVLNICLYEKAKNENRKIPSYEVFVCMTTTLCGFFSFETNLVEVVIE